MRGLQNADVNTANEDANIIASRTLDNGVVGTVHEQTRADFDSHATKA